MPSPLFRWNYPADNEAIQAMSSEAQAGAEGEKGKGKRKGKAG